MCATLGALTAAALLPVLPWWEAVYPGRDRRPHRGGGDRGPARRPADPDRVRHALSVESGFYDGFALAILLIALGLASQRSDPGAGRWAWFIFSTEIFSLVAGAAVGLAGGWVIAGPASGAG